MAVVQVLGETPVFRERVTLEVSQFFRVRRHIAIDRRIRLLKRGLYDVVLLVMMM